MPCPSSTRLNPRPAISASIWSPRVWRPEFQQVEKAGSFTGAPGPHQRCRMRLDAPDQAAQPRMPVRRLLSRLAAQGSGCPRHQAHLVFLVEVRMDWDYANVEAVAAAFRSGDSPAERVYAAGAH